jgi:hypothetical protein
MALLHQNKALLLTKPVERFIDGHILVALHHGVILVADQVNVRVVLQEALFKGLFNVGSVFKGNAWLDDSVVAVLLVGPLDVSSPSSSSSGGGGGGSRGNLLLLLLIQTRFNRVYGQSRKMKRGHYYCEKKNTFCFSSMRAALKYFTPEEFALEREWLDIRDMLLGNNYVQQDIEQALQRAAVCQHKYAKHLNCIFKDKAVKTTEEARQVFLSQPPDDAIALCFSEALQHWTVNYDFGRIKRSAELGFAFALSYFRQANGLYEGDAEIAQRERTGFLYKAGVEYAKGNNVVAGMLLEVAAELGSVMAMIAIGMKFDQDDPKVWIWFAKSLEANKTHYDYVFNAIAYVESIRVRCQVRNPACLFQIGKTCKQKFDPVHKMLCGEKLDEDCKFYNVKFAIKFYTVQLHACRKAVDAWSCVALRNRVCKDIRILIGKYIWFTRHEANYEPKWRLN